MWEGGRPASRNQQSAYSTYHFDDDESESVNVRRRSEVERLSLGFLPSGMRCDISGRFDRFCTGSVLDEDEDDVMSVLGLGFQSRMNVSYVIICICMLIPLHCRVYRDRE